MNITETAREIYDLVKKGATIGLQEKVMEMREEALQLQEENIALKKRVRELETEKELERSISFDGRAYWITKADSEGKPTKDGPFCQPCYDDKQKFVRLHRITAEFQNYTGGGWQCHICDGIFEDARHAPKC